jgi:hypothetical protein
MSRNIETRLAKLEQARNPSPTALVIIWKAVKVDGSDAEPTRYESNDGAHCWDRRQDETAEAFGKRVCADAEQLAKTVVLLPSNCREI